MILNTSYVLEWYIDRVFDEHYEYTLPKPGPVTIDLSMCWGVEPFSLEGKGLGDPPDWKDDPNLKFFVRGDEWKTLVKVYAPHTLLVFDDFEIILAKWARSRRPNPGTI